MRKLLTASCAALLLVVAPLAGPVTGSAEAEVTPHVQHIIHTNHVVCDTQCVQYVQWVQFQRTKYIQTISENTAAKQGNWLAILAIAKRYFPPDTDWGWLARTINRETGGTWNPRVENPISTASGLLQMLDEWDRLLSAVTGCPTNDQGMYDPVCALGAGAQLYDISRRTYGDGRTPWYPLA